MAQDFYAVLEVARDATEADIKRAYRKLARTHHPDINQDPQAGERFKRISEAYHVLSDPQRRRLYDRYGEDGLREGFDEQAYERMRQSHGAGVDLDEIFGRAGGTPFGGGFGGFGGAGFGTGLTRGRDLATRLRLPFGEAVRGGTQRLTYGRPTRCSACAGHGRQGDSRCGVCGGAGLVEAPTTIQVRIPPGADTGDRIRVSGRGGDARVDGPPGDLVLEVAVDPDPRFVRDGRDVTVVATISPLDALLGCAVEVDLPIGGVVEVSVPPGASSTQKLRVRARGITRGNQRGDLFVALAIDGGAQKLRGRALEIAQELRTVLEADAKSASTEGPGATSNASTP